MCDVSAVRLLMQDIVKEPVCVFELLGGAVPAVAAYFMQLILISALLGLTLEFSRLVALLQLWWFEYNEKKSGVAPRARDRFFRKSIAKFMPSLMLPGCILVAVLLFTYATIVPFLLLTTSVYFSLAFVVYKHHLVYVYIPCYESGGSLFPSLYSKILTALHFSNATMVGYMIIKEGWIEVIVLLIIFPVVEVFRGHVKVTHLARMAVLSRAAAVQQDIEAEAGTECHVRGLPCAGFDDNLYRQPPLKLPLFAPEVGSNGVIGEELLSLPYR